MILTARVLVIDFQFWPDCQVICFLMLDNGNYNTVYLKWTTMTINILSGLYILINFYSFLSGVFDWFLECFRFLDEQLCPRKRETKTNGLSFWYRKLENTEYSIYDLWQANRLIHVFLKGMVVKETFAISIYFIFCLVLSSIFLILVGLYCYFYESSLL